MRAEQLVQNPKSGDIPQVRIGSKRLAGWPEFGLILMVLFVFGGDAAPHRNEAHYLSRFKHFWTPEWCAGDFFLESPDAHYTLVSLLAWSTQFLTLASLAWFGRFFSWALISWAWVRLARQLGLSGFMTTLSATLMLALTESAEMAGEWIVGGFEAKVPAYALVLFALSEIMVRRWNRAWLLLGAASALHILVGGWSALVLFGYWFVRDRNEVSIARIFPGLIGLVILAQFGAMPALVLNSFASPDEIAEANQIYVFTRLPHHLALLHMPLDWLSWKAGQHFLLLTILAWLQLGWLNQQHSESSRGLRLLTWFAWSAVALSCTGFCIEIIGWNDRAWAASWLRYYWFRLSDIAAPIAVASLICSWLQQELERGQRRAPIYLACLIAFSTLIASSYVLARFNDPPAPADSKMLDHQAWAELCTWIDKNTEQDALFMIPRMAASFNWRASRASVVCYKDVPQNVKDLIEWNQRHTEIYQIGTWPEGRPQWTPSLASLGAERLATLAAKYDAQYAVSEDPLDQFGQPISRASLPILKRMGPYTLYDLRLVGHNLSE